MDSALLREYLTAKHVSPDVDAVLARVVPEPDCPDCQAVLAGLRTRTAAAGDSKASLKAKNKLKGKVTGAEKLRQYWLNGEGAAKIRWGQEGDWTRCVRHLSKHLGPRAKGYCQLLHGRKLGKWAGKNSHKKAPNPAVKARAMAKQFSR
ncbi:MAG: hypothetical protein ACOYOQ_00155 [Microthrixaceae bacterium]